MIESILKELLSLFQEAIKPETPKTGADLVAALWIDNPQDWKEVESYPIRYEHVKIPLVVLHDYLLGIVAARFNDEQIAISSVLGAKMHHARQRYKDGINNKKMDATARSLAEAILAWQDKP